MKGSKAKEKAKKAEAGKKAKGGKNEKLDICFDHSRGQCNRGDSCRFSHDLPANGQIPPRPVSSQTVDT